MHPRLRFTALVSGVLAVGACGSDSSSSGTSTPTTPATTTTIACSTPQSLSVGQVLTGVSGTTLCVGGVSSASAQYTLIPYNNSTATGDATASFSVAATGTTSPSSLPDLISSNGASLDLISGGLGLSARPRPDDSFELGLRARERAGLTRLIPAARSWNRARTASHAAFDVIPRAVSVGQILRLNADATTPCSSPNYRGARVVAITNKAIVVADTGNPAGGYTDAEYAGLGTTFDTLIDPLDRAAFGDPSDIDGNGKIILFFTKTVNDLTPTSSSSYIGGFFYARDLFPVTTDTTLGLDACATSNVGEMFYIMVPDPNRGGVFSKSSVASEVTGTLAHEYQHLINASRRIYVNNASDFEETWLDEGLAHTAEELLFFRVSGLSPRQNLDATAIRASSVYVDAFNNYDSNNFGRYNEYLNNPTTYSPYADNDSLATRGAIRAFLRYAADRAGSTDGTTFYRLVNSTTTGIANLENVFGTGVINEIRDWGISVDADDLPGVATTYQQPTWNYRSMFAALSNSSVFPLTYVSLSVGSHPVSLNRGSNAYLRFSVPAGGAALLQWPTAPSNVSFSLIRTQ
ncbi:MAG: hypothetical protein ABI442_12605 [Gemmatimonadaceae bacterium]